MSESASPKPGPNPSDSKEATMQALRETELPALTAGDVADRIDYTRKTAGNRLQELEDEGRIESGNIGGNTAYWLPSDPYTPDGVGGYIGGIPQSALNPLGTDLGFVFALAGIGLALAHPVAGVPLTLSVVAIGLAFLFYNTAAKYEDVKDPSYRWRDLANALNEEEQ